MQSERVLDFESERVLEFEPERVLESESVRRFPVDVLELLPVEVSLAQQSGLARLPAAWDLFHLRRLTTQR